jgi:Uma2 family endonuclease
MTAAPHAPRPARFTKAEYYRMGEVGVFDARRVELIGGEIIEMSPIGPLHAAVVAHVHRVLDRLVPDHHVRAQLPFNAAEDSEPEPDLALVPGSPADYQDGHPRRVALIIEVADSSLKYDRSHKASRYAASGVADYWIINLLARQVEIYRGPERDPSQDFGFGYASHDIVDASGQLSPLAVPSVTIAVKDLLL